MRMSRSAMTPEFSIDYYSSDTVIGYLYSAENEEGYSIEVCYRAEKCHKHRYFGAQFK